MRLREYLFAIFAGATNFQHARDDSLGEDPECLDRQIRLWLHIDMTGSFNGWRQQSMRTLATTVEKLGKKYVNLKFGVSGFGDRPNGKDAANVPGQRDYQCYIPVVDFDTPVDQKKFDRMVSDLAYSQYPGYEDDEEDPLSALPWLAKNKFGDYGNYELRIAVVLTDNGPHFGPDWPCDGNDEPSQPAEDYVTCDKTKRYATLDELFDPIKTRRVFPLIAVYPHNSCVEEWTKVLTTVGYEPSQQLVDMGRAFDAQKFLDAVENVINANSCSPAPTVAPHDGTVPTDSTSTTHPVQPTQEPSDDTTTRGGSPTKKPDGPTTTKSGGTTGSSSSHTVTPAIIGASAGAAALLAAGTAYRFYPTSTPAAQLIGSADAAAPDTTGPERESAITMTEDAYQ